MFLKMTQQLRVINTPQLASPLSFAPVSKAYPPFLAENYPPI